MEMEEIKEHLPWIIGILLACVDISPIKVNPLKFIAKIIGKIISDWLFGDVKQQLSEMRHDIDENEMDAIRWEVLSFANSCRHGQKHSKEEFEHVIRQNTKYHELLKRTNRENGVFDLEYKYIKEIYERRLRDNDFLV